MRKVIKEVGVYKFDELSDKAKERVKEILLDNPDRITDFADSCKSMLKAYFPHSNLDIQFSLNYCQGDGVNIMGELHFQDALNFINDKSNHTGEFQHFCGMLEEDEQKILMDYMSYGMDAICLPYNHSYKYCVAHLTDFADEWYDKVCSINGDEPANKDVIEKAEKLVRHLFTALSFSFEQFGYRYLYEMSDREIQDIVDANEMEFMEDGSIFYEK